MRGFLWPTEFLVFSDFLVADPHAHGALQLSVGIEGARASSWTVPGAGPAACSSIPMSRTRSTATGS